MAGDGTVDLWIVSPKPQLLRYHANTYSEKHIKLKLTVVWVFATLCHFSGFLLLWNITKETFLFFLSFSCIVLCM